MHEYSQKPGSLKPFHWNRRSSRLFAFSTACQRQKASHLRRGHGVFPDPDAVRENLNWLDEYFGPAQR
jgi:hypothetical protein